MSRALEPRPSRYVTMSEACRIIGVSRSRLYRMVKDGRVRIASQDGQMMLLRSHVEKVKRACTCPEYPVQKDENCVHHSRRFGR